MQGKVEKETSWSVTLRPNRSLTRQGLVAVVTIVTVFNLVAGVLFWVAGAWPVLGFMGLDAVLVWWALSYSWRAAERFERISISGDTVTLLHKPGRGRPTSEHFNRRWLRIDLEFDEARELVGKLHLAYRGRRHEIGSFLGAEDRRSLALALRRVIPTS